MGGGLMQLVAYGAQDIYLTGNPQITFFKVVYRRHTNFSMETIQQTISGASQLTSSNDTGTVTISRNGDLVSKVYVRCDANDGTDCISGDQLISEVEIEIGGQRIDRHYREWLQVWEELSTPESKAAGFKYMSAGFSNKLMVGGTTGGTTQQSVFVPLQFWFCRNPGLALPLIALQYHEVKLKFTWGTTTEVSRDGIAYGTPAPTCEVWCDYIYLDTDERRRFAQVSHEYLIEQVQRDAVDADKSSLKLNFNHPVKELVWTTGSNTPWSTQKCKLKLNGHDRFAQQDKEYFQLRQPFDYHTSIPGYNIKESDMLQFTTPVEIFNGLHNDATAAAPSGAGDGGQAILTSTTVTFHGDHIATDISVGDFLKVGDVLKIEVFDHNATDATGTASISQFVQVTSLTSTIVTFTVYQSNATATDLSTLGLRANDSKAMNVADNDPIFIHLLARLQEPKSRCSQLASDINVYSFALKPEEHQPSGTCNFSRIDNAQLVFNADTGVDKVYAVNYNVLRIMSGMGGLAYSN